jgi:alpha-L-rhamnosidase
MLSRNIGDFWDSGQIQSGESTFIFYRGKAVGQSNTVYWKVKLLNSQGKEGSWSSVARWTASPSWNSKWIGLPSALVSGEDVPANNGFHGAVFNGPEHAQWVQIDLGSSRSFSQIQLFPARPYDFVDTPGFLFPVRFAIDVSDDPDGANAQRIVDQTNEDFANPGATPVIFNREAKGRYVRLVVTRLAHRDSDSWSYALAEMGILADGKDIALKQRVTASEATTNSDWSLNNLVDGVKVSHGAKTLEPLPANYIRKEFESPSQVKKALLFVSALGCYEAYINGERVGDHILAPEWTDYRDRSQFQGYDVTKQIRAGNNCIAAILGDGWYSGRIAWYDRGTTGRIPAFLAQLEIEFTDGKKKVVSTGERWQGTDQGPIIASDLLDGEKFDARKEMSGWNLAGFKTADWKYMAVVQDKLPKALNFQMNPAIRQVQTLSPVSVRMLKPQVYVVDLGQNMVGWSRIRCTGKAGTTVTLRFGEVLNEDGSVYYENLRSASQTDSYTFAKDGVATFEPHFTYHGFRYIEIKGVTAPIRRNDVKGIVFNSFSPETAQFECSNPMVNRLWKNIFWTQRANLMSVPTDCPQRNERLGWMGDIQAFSQTACYNMDMSGFFAKWMQDVRDAQSEEGMYADYSPFPGAKGTAMGAPAWSDAGVFVPWTAYVNYGDKRLIERHYESAKRYVDLLHRNNPNGLWLNRRGSDYNDWLNGDTLVQKGWPTSGGTIPNEVLATAFMARSTEIVAEMATVLGKSDDAVLYQGLWAKSKDAFCKAYVDPEGKIKGDTQAGYALALSFNLLPDDVRPLAVQHLKKALNRYDDHVSTGIQTTHHLMLQLSRYGGNDLAYKLLLNRTFPSWGYTIDYGATTIWERWDGFVKGRGFQNPGMNSMNHWALGSVGEWIAKVVGGISPGDEPGWKHPVIHPIPGGDLKWAKLRYDSIQGPIRCSWSIEKGPFTMEVSIPVGVVATVYIPASSASRVLESGTIATQAESVTFIRMEGDSAIFSVGSGNYSFSVSR